MKRQLQLRLVLTIASTSLALCAAEWIARRLRPEALEAVSLSLYARDKTTSFALRKGHESDQPDGSHVRVNSFGVRDAELVIPKPPGVTRVLCLGDSFTFGLGVNDDESFPEVCERTLREMHGGAIEVVNCGVPAWGTEESLLFLETRGLSLEPDAVVLGAFPTNDAFDDSASQEYSVIDGRIVPSAAEPTTVTWIDHSALYRLIHDKFGPQQPAPDPASRRGGARQRSLLEQFEVHNKSISPDSDLAIGRVQVRANIERVRDLLAAKKIPFGVVIVPSLREVDVVAYAEILRRDALSEGAFDQSWPSSCLALDVTALGVPYLDLGPIMREATSNQGRSLYLRNYHFNAAGNALAGRRIAMFLSERLGVRLR